MSHVETSRADWQRNANVFIETKCYERQKWQQQPACFEGWREAARRYQKERRGEKEESIAHPQCGSWTSAWTSKWRWR